MATFSSLRCAPSRYFLQILIVAFGGCDTPAGPPADRNLAIIAGAEQIGGAGASLPNPVVVHVAGPGEAPLPGVEVRWRVIQGGGSASDVVTLTDSLGNASVRWTLGYDLGPQLLLATSGNSSLTITATSTFQIVSVAAGFHHTCALSSAGDAFCWGSNQQGQLGDATETSSSVPVRVKANVRFRLLTAGWSHTCGLLQAGAAFCWGDNTVGQLGNGSAATRSHVPAPVAGTDAFIDLSAGFAHTCGVTPAGDAVCWGANDQGQLGASQTTRSRISGMQFQAISASEFHTCGIRADRTAACWGWNSTGDLGTGAPFGSIAATPSQVAGSVRFSAIAAGVRHTCAISTDANVFCWGRNAIGETGQDPFSHVSVPAAVPGADNFSAIGTGNTHTCGLSQQHAFCWGTLLGNGTSGSSKTPVPVSFALLFSSISVGFAHTCGVASGEVWCWGSNSHGQLGQRDIAQSPVPVRIPTASF